MNDLHFFYVGSSDDDFTLNQGKGGETGDPYMRLQQYGTGYFGNNKFRFRLLFSLKNTDKKQIRIIEKKFLNSFEQIESDSEDEDDLNQASTIEGIQYTNLEEIKVKFIKVIQELHLENSFNKVYETSEEINAILKEYRSKQIKKVESKSLTGKILRNYQDDDVKATYWSFIHDKIKRGYWNIECGLGKTIMAIELILRMKMRQNFFVVPRNTLLYQVLETLLECNFTKSEIYVCNGTKNPDKFNDIKKVKTYKELPKETRYICLTTYDSLINLKGANIDFIVFDEAHHLVSSSKKTDLSGNLFGLSDENINSEYRLSITGTVKDINLNENDTITYSGMSHQPELYGICLAERNYSFGFKNGYLSQFETICIKTNQDTIRQTITSIKQALKLSDGTFQEFLIELKKWEDGRSRAMREYIDRVDEDDKISPDTILWYGIVSLLLIETIYKYNSQRIITYHTTKERAQLFTEIFKTIWEMKKISKSLFIDTVSSSNSQTVNDSIKKEFKEKDGAEVRILANIRILIEGFDDPSVDTTVFVDNKWSAIESKQIIGRGNRKDPNNPFKVHKVVIPFIQYESYIDENTIVLKSTNDYKTVRYTIKNIIHSDDPSLTISQTVWVPKNLLTDTSEKTSDKTEIDIDERLYIPEDSFEIHDSSIIGNCVTNELAEKSFQNARIWMHVLAKKLGWDKFTKESQLVNAWNNYKETHILPKDIPCNPSNVYKQVGWINMRDYAGILTTRSEWQEIKEGELIELIRAGIVNPYDCTLKMLREAIEKVSTRKLPIDHKKKWNTNIYDLVKLALPNVKPKWIGQYPESMYAILQKGEIADALDFERFWPELHTKYINMPGMPCDVWGETFWADYEP